MKKLIIANCILAIAVIFSFCAKPDLKEELSASTDAVAGNRATCTLVSNPGNINTTITICGTNTNLLNCKSCIGTLATGVEVFNGSVFSLALQTPIVISIRNTNATAYNLDAGGPNGPLPPINVGPNECRRFFIDDNCDITAL